MEKSNKTLIKHIQERACQYLDNDERTRNVLDAMLDVDRSCFIPLPTRAFAFDDEPVHIGYQQTCSQPSMVAFMLDKLNILPGNIILEIGAGCGYAAAIASKLCGRSGKVFACEIIPELASLMKENLKEFQGNIQILSSDGSAGFPNLAPFDRIFLSAGSASGNFNRDLLISQLSSSGVLIYPEVQGNLYKITRTDNGVIEETYYGVSFVPLIGKNA